MTIEDWLEDRIRESAERATAELFGWSIGRGLSSALFLQNQIGLWETTRVPCPDPGFVERMGVGGKARDGWMVIPVRSPRGVIGGVEFRTWGDEATLEGKVVRDYRTPSSKTSPLFIGMTENSLDKIWKGGDVWLVEGIFDMSLAHVVPAKDAVLACGTARLTGVQIDFLKRFLASGAMVHLAWDQDETGLKQARGYIDPNTGKAYPGAVRTLEKRGLRVRHVMYRGGKDPGEIWERGGKPALKKAFNL